MVRPWLVLALIGCSPSPAPQPLEATPPAASATVALPASASAVAAPVPADGAPCGPLECRSYGSAEAAFEAILADRPRVLAIGEAHAQAGDEDVASATKRFTETLLPKLGGSASDVVLELTVPPKGGCGAARARVEGSVGEVTQSQAKENKNEFVLLGEAADKLAIRPHVLRPTCADLEGVAAGGQQDVGRLLELIARLTGDLVHNILTRNEQAGADKTVIAYGGALHNDVAPRPGRESWSFGAQLAKRASPYVELDLIVPEYIRETPSWQSLEWYPHYRPEHGARHTLFRLRPGSYVLVFARSR